MTALLLPFACTGALCICACMLWGTVTGRDLPRWIDAVLLPASFAGVLLGHLLFA